MIGDIFQPTHLLFLLVVVLLVLGPKRLPEVAKSLGRGFRDFKDAISGETHPAYSELHQQPIPPNPVPMPPDPVETSHAAEPVAAPPEGAATESVATPPHEAAVPPATSMDEAAGEPVPTPEAPEPEPVATPAASKDSDTDAD